MYDYGARNYAPALGRWMNIDPLAEKAFNFSPNTYAINNPVYFIDPDGKEIDISLIYKKDKNGKEIRDKDGNRILTNVNITITGKIINFSDNNVDMDKAVSDITTSLEKSFSGTFGDDKVKATANFSVANSMKDVKDSDHLLVLAQKIKPQFDENGQMIGEPFGISNFFDGKVAFVDADYFSGLYDKYIGNQGERTSAHEFGHLFGLEHVMGGLMQGGGDGTNLSPTQFGTIIKNYKEGKLNYGTNSTIFGLPNTGIIGSDNVILTNTNGREKKKS
ncbi:RHS repeat domain-containing protein [Flavobacterium chilense]|uniref:RHS repeat domain-containing protein n=1 Tax=Flavobacterium chilense TaxID=946677 RepID=UPI001FD74B80